MEKEFINYPWPGNKKQQAQRAKNKPSDMNHRISVGFNCMDGQYDVTIELVNVKKSFGCKIVHESKWLASFDTKEEAIEFAISEIKRLNIDPNWRDRL